MTEPAKRRRELLASLQQSAERIYLQTPRNVQSGYPDKIVLNVKPGASEQRSE